MNIFEIVGNLGGRKFVVLVIGIICLTICACFKVDNTIIFTIGGMISAYVVGQGISDGMSKGITSSSALAVSSKFNIGSLRKPTL